MQNRLNDFADWTIKYKEFTEADYPHYKSVVAQNCIREQVRCNNLINELSTRYILYGMVILMEDGFGKKKLTNFKDKFSDHMDKAGDKCNGKDFMDLWRELVENTGIYIEKPIFE